MFNYNKMWRVLRSIWGSFGQNIQFLFYFISNFPFDGKYVH